MDSGTGLASNAVLCLLQQSDQSSTAFLGLSELNSSLNLGQHGAGSELASSDVLLSLCGGQVSQPLNVGLTEVDSNLLNCGQDDQAVSIQLLCQNTGSEVLVDDSCCTLQVMALGLDNRDTAAAASDDNLASFDQSLDGVQLNDALGRGEATT